ncbi:MAG: hypothetical protein ACYSXF_09980 [Planctomycetota bacterium]|jgi:hypothetical protein
MATLRARTIARTTSRSWPPNRRQSIAPSAGAAAMKAARTAKGIAKMLCASLMSPATTRRSRSRDDPGVDVATPVGMMGTV